MGKRMMVTATLAAKKTEEKLSVLAGMVSSNLEDLANAYTTSEDLKTVRFHFHTPPMAVDLGKMDFINGLSEKEAEYVKTNASSFRFFCFKNEAKKLKSISESIRCKLKTLTVGNSDYMSADDFYNNFLPYLAEKENELEMLKQSIESYYDSELEAFSDNVINVVRSVCPNRLDSARAAVAYVTGRTKDAFLDDISFDLETGFKEDSVEDGDLSDLLKRSKEAFVLREIEGIYIGQLQKLWDAMSHFITVIKAAPESLSGYGITRRTVKEAAEKVERYNVGRLPVITDISTSIINLSKEENTDMANVESFNIMSEIFGKGAEMGASFKFTEDLPDWVSGEALLEAYNAA